METPQADASWTGWAISSFTNKLATASGQMETPSNGDSRVTSPEPRPNSVPPSAGASRPTPLAVARGLQPQLAAAKDKSSNPFTSSNASQADDTELDTGWGDDGAGWDDDAGAADPFAAPPAQSNALDSTAFDDKGEPDFAGWIAAQSKQKAKNPLPKGLAKTSAAGSRPGLGAKANSTGNPGAKKVVAKPKIVPKVVAKAEPEEEEEDDAWGEAW
jgi:SCY1-like protein 1